MEIRRDIRQTLVSILPYWFGHLSRKIERENVRDKEKARAREERTKEKARRIEVKLIFEACS